MKASVHPKAKAYYRAGIVTNSIPLWSLENYIIITPQNPVLKNIKAARMGSIGVLLQKLLPCDLTPAPLGSTLVLGGSGYLATRLGFRFRV